MSERRALEESSRNSQRRSHREKGSFARARPDPLARSSGLGNGWTWQNPLPAGARLKTICRSPGGDVLASGLDGVHLKKAGASWQPVTADYSLRTTASFVAADGTTLAVGAEVGADSYRLLAWNGRRWKALGEVGVPVVALWAFSAKDVWLGGTDPGTGYPVALRWNGTDAEMMTLEETEGVSVRSIWASGPSDVWMTAVKNDNALASLYHWDGQTWAREEIETVTTPPPSAGVGAAQQVQGLWGAGAGRPVLAVSCGVHHCGGKGLRVWERSGTAWSATEPELELFPTALTGMPNGTFVVAANDYGSDETMFVVGKGSAWTREPSGVTQEVDFLASTSTGEVWAVGEAGPSCRGAPTDGEASSLGAGTISRTSCASPTAASSWPGPTRPRRKGESRGAASREP
ncbi:MAG: hypothetical protein IPP07_19270 [Holophagales bacterium]|nr:hypothetical protein [Holophagales bacterium]